MGATEVVRKAAGLIGTVFITLDPTMMAGEVLRSISAVVALGHTAAEVLARYCAAVHQPAPDDRSRVNLAQFVEILGGLDDDTWFRHLNAGDFANWFVM